MEKLNLKQLNGLWGALSVHWKGEERGVPCLYRGLCQSLQASLSLLILPAAAAAAAHD